MRRERPGRSAGAAAGVRCPAWRQARCGDRSAWQRQALRSRDGQAAGRTGHKSRFQVPGSGSGHQDWAPRPDIKTIKTIRVVRAIRAARWRPAAGQPALWGFGRGTRLATRPATRLEWLMDGTGRATGVASRPPAPRCSPSPPRDPVNQARAPGACRGGTRTPAPRPGPPGPADCQPGRARRAPRCPIRWAIALHHLVVAQHVHVEGRRGETGLVVIPRPGPGPGPGACRPPPAPRPCASSSGRRAPGSSAPRLAR